MHSVTRRLAELEVLRYFRRRETFWTLLGLASLLALGHVALLLAWGREETKLPGVASMADVFRGLLLFVEAACLCALAIQGGARSVRQELDSGSWILLAQTPNPLRRIWAGKLVGVVVALLAAHGLLSLPILAFTPLVRRTHLEVAAVFIGVFVYAAALVPEGMSRALVEQRSPRLVYLLRFLSALRLVTPVPFLVAAIRPDPLGARPSPETIGQALSPVPNIEAPGPELFAHWWVPFAIVLSAQLLWAFPWWVALVRSRR